MPSYAQQRVTSAPIGRRAPIASAVCSAGPAPSRPPTATTAGTSTLQVLLCFREQVSATSLALPWALGCRALAPGAGRKGFSAPEEHGWCWAPRPAMRRSPTSGSRCRRTPGSGSRPRANVQSSGPSPRIRAYPVWVHGSRDVACAGRRYRGDPRAARFDQVSPATSMGPGEPSFRHGHGTTCLPVMGPPGVAPVR